MEISLKKTVIFHQLASRQEYYPPYCISWEYISWLGLVWQTRISEETVGLTKLDAGQDFTFLGCVISTGTLISKKLRKKTEIKIYEAIILSFFFLWYLILDHLLAPLMSLRNASTSAASILLSKFIGMTSLQTLKFSWVPALKQWYKRLHWVGNIPRRNDLTFKAFFLSDLATSWCNWRVPWKRCKNFIKRPLFLIWSMTADQKWRQLTTSQGLSTI